MSTWNDPAVIAELAGAGATFLVGLAAIGIALASERKATRRAEDDRKSYAEAAALDARRDRLDQWRARNLDLLLRLLNVVADDARHGALSAHGKALCLALRNQRNLIGAAWDAYVEELAHPDGVPFGQRYVPMLEQITDAIASLDTEERLAPDLNP